MDNFNSYRISNKKGDSFMKLSEWAKKNGICYVTSLSWFHSGKIPNAR